MRVSICSAFSYLPGLPASLFDPSGRLVTVPRDTHLRERVLSWLVDGFNPGRRYTESEVNAVLASTPDDHAALRRYLVDSGRLRREDDGSAYWRAPSEES